MRLLSIWPEFYVKKPCLHQVLLWWESIPADQKSHSSVYTRQAAVCSAISNWPDCWVQINQSTAFNHQVLMENKSLTAPLKRWRLTILRHYVLFNRKVPTFWADGRLVEL